MPNFIIDNELKKVYYLQEIVIYIFYMLISSIYLNHIQCNLWTIHQMNT